jgi:hypothetical protein
MKIWFAILMGISIGAIAPLSTAQAEAMLAVGPDAGGYLCPDGRQLYVKSCYDDSADSTCGVVIMNLPLQNGFQREAVETRRHIAASVAGCQVNPVAFSGDGTVGLVAPAPANPPSTATASTPEDSTASARLETGEDILLFEDGIAIGRPGLRSSLFRVTPAGETSRIVFVDEASRRKTSQKNIVAIWSLATYIDGVTPYNKTAAVWVENRVDCKLKKFERTLFVTLSRITKLLSVSAENAGVVAKTDADDKAIADIACKRAKFSSGPRYDSAYAAMTAAFDSAAPKVRLPETEAEKSFFAAIKGNMMQAAVNASITNADGKPVPVVELADEQGMTALHWAAENSSAGAFRWLLDKRPGVNLRDKKGRTPLKIALDKKDERVMKMLLNLSGADPRLALPGHDEELKALEKTDELVAFMIKASTAQ